MSYRFIAATFSICLMSTSLFFWFSSGNSKYGIDFAGGTEVVIKFDQTIQIASLRKLLVDNGLSSPVVQEFNSVDLAGEGIGEFSIKA